MGMRGSRVSRVGAASETMRRKRDFSAAKRRMAGTTPAVEMEIASAEMARPAGWDRMRAAAMTLS